MTQNTKVWLWGLGAAAIGAFGSSLATIAVAPDRFNLTSWHGAGRLLILAVVSGVINGGAYLAKSPLPALSLAPQPGDKLQVKNLTLAADGSGSADSATLTKGSGDTKS